MIDPTIVCSFLYVITKYGYPPPPEQTGTYLTEMKALGFQSVELEGIRRDHLRAVHNRRHEIAYQLRQLELAAPYFCIVLPGLASASGPEREQNLQLFRLGCETAARLGAIGVLDNAPLPPYVFPNDIPIVRHYDEAVLQTGMLPKDLSWSAYWAELVATYQVACDIANEFGLTYHLHPCLGVLAATTEGFLYFRDAIKRDNLRFTLDTANQFVQKDNLALSLRRLAGCLDYIHLSDNRGSQVEHLAPEQGAINWDIFFETLDLIGFKGHIGIDVGGNESGVADLEEAYRQTAAWLAGRWGLG